MLGDGVFSDTCPSPSPLEWRGGASMGYASEASISLLLRLVFERREIAALLQRLGGESGAEALQLGSQCRRLARLVKEDRRAAHAFDHELSLRLAPPMNPSPTGSLERMASLWARQRDASSGYAGAAMLWSVARQPAHCWRKLESVIVEDLSYLAARALFCTSGEHPDTPQASHRAPASRVD